jgi:hypothetical protein
LPKTKRRGYIKYRIRITELYDEITEDRESYVYTKNRNRFWVIEIIDGKTTTGFRVDSKAQLLKELKDKLCMVNVKGD